MSKCNDIVWKPVSSTEVFDAKVVRVCEKKCTSPEGTEKSFTSLKAPDWVIVVPVYKGIEDDEFIMVKQWRHGAENVFMEFPGGVINEGEEPEDAAFRELMEETGRPPFFLRLLGELSPNPAIMENTCYVFFAAVGPHRATCEFDFDEDEDEFLNVISVPVQQVLENMGQGEYTHALMNSAMFLYLKSSGYFN